jgi:hypothetical protein
MNGALDRFFAHYYRRRPVTATFTGVHTFDALLPDWSPDGLSALDAEMRDLIGALSAEYPPGAPAEELRRDVDALDAELARRFLEIQLAENESGHGVRANPSLWTGEAIFGVISLMIRDFAPVEQRMESAIGRLEAVPRFLDTARETLDHPSPSAWTAKARRECDGAAILLGGGIEKWLATGAPNDETQGRLRGAAARARSAFAQFSNWLATRAPAPDSAIALGAEAYDFLLDRGHCCERPRADLLAAAHGELKLAERHLDEAAIATAGSWASAREQLAARHPTPEAYLASFARVWDACRARAAERDVVTWGDWPIRYVPYPDWTADAAPFLYYLFYRSPAPFDHFDVYDYVVPALPAERAEQHLRTWNDGVIKLNHVVHHGAIGHHVQNWHAATRTQSRIGRIAGVDCASRLAMLSAATMAEGWACYATQLMEELDFLSPLERLSEAHSQVRFLARAIIDIELHQGTMTFDEAVRFWSEHVGGTPEAARGEAVKASMFPCTAIIYWLGTGEIVRLRETLERERGNDFSLKAFHDELLDHGSIPVALAARLMTSRVDQRVATPRPLSETLS